MKIRLKRKTISLKRFLHLPLLVFVVATTIALGAVAAVSRQQTQIKSSQDHKPRMPIAKTVSSYVAVEVAGQKVQVDGQTGQIRPLTAEEARKMADGIEKLVDQSSEGLTAVHHPDGSVSVDLQERFQNVAVARRNADGTVSQSCIDNLQSATEFFEIDPQVFGDETKTVSGSKSKPESTKHGNRAMSATREDQ